MTCWNGKAVLVTGGGGAIGAAIRRRFAEEGARQGEAGQVISVPGGLTMAG